MNSHPGKEDWMSQLYGETTPDKQAEMDAHLAACPECQRNVAGWRTAMEALDAWQLPRRATRPVVASPQLKWAIAALLMLGFGLMLGRVTTPSRASAEEIAATLTPQLRGEMQTDLLAALSGEPAALTNEFRQALHARLQVWSAGTLLAARQQSETLVGDLAQSVATAREEDQQALATTVQRLDRQHQTAIAGLRRDLETVAVVAEDQFNRTREDLGELATYSFAANNNNSPVNP